MDNHEMCGKISIAEMGNEKESASYIHGPV